jgi:hypothetical protein
VQIDSDSDSDPSTFLKVPKVLADLLNPRPCLPDHKLSKELLRLLEDIMFDVDGEPPYTCEPDDG